MVVMVVVVVFGSEEVVVGRPQAEMEAKDANRKTVGAYSTVEDDGMTE